MIAQGDIFWAELPEPSGSGSGFHRPVVVVQSDAINRSRISTTICVPLTSKLAWAEAPGNVMLSARATGLPKDSVANVSLVFAVDQSFLGERAGRLRAADLTLILDGIDVVLRG